MQHVTKIHAQHVFFLFVVQEDARQGVDPASRIGGHLGESRKDWASQSDPYWAARCLETASFALSKVWRRMDVGTGKDGHGKYALKRVASMLGTDAIFL